MNVILCKKKNNFRFDIKKSVKFNKIEIRLVLPIHNLMMQQRLVHIIILVLLYITFFVKKEIRKI